VEIQNQKILIVDSELDTAKFIAKKLTISGYQVYLSTNGKEGLFQFFKEKPDLVIIDLLLSKQDGYQVCQKIRENSKIPILILTSQNRVSDKVMSFELGANDFFIKPFSFFELEARIRSLLRDFNQQNNHVLEKDQKIKVGNLVINLDTCEVSKNNAIVKITNIEYTLLELLINNSGKTLSRLSILDNIWGYKPERQIDTRIVDVHIARLRAKIEEDPHNPDLILTVRRTGYMFKKK
jgi:OmpR family response regulator RpaB